MRLKVGLYLNDPQANLLKFVRALRNWNLSFVSIWRDELPVLRPGDVDVLLLHGGWYGIDRVPAQEQYTAIKRRSEHKRMAEAVRQYVRGGGGVVGVCAGAFNVVWLGLLEGDISRMHGAGPHMLEVVDERHPILTGLLDRAKGRRDRRWQPIPVTRVSGPVFFPKSPRQMVLSYDWEHRLGAVLAGDFGRGRAVAISPHPEMTEHECDEEVCNEPLPKASVLLKNALYWSARARV